ncbi:MULTISPECIES: hypothetical protein [unclassified Pseudoxanthomonas]|uniref:hypothetical protein n=1 Tax=unclassified Pseudoxanthomonas TaxID=2645906 RepID=UPI001614CA4D|nr:MULTISPECIES: hypothetical protein [unclassified Pseudoxanthomonas]MBB3274842.1 hypothetical protein [Pseudoxanthomonas sp. OG2]MBV7475265.1 hypothetical protein [Pseudoxanthomonas sp. PXM05]
MAANKKIVALGVAALLIGAACWHFFGNDTERESRSDFASERVSGQKSEDPQEPLPPTTTAARSMVSSSVVFQHYQCPPGMEDCERNPNVAATPEDAQWLLTHGYPTVKQIQDLRTRSTADYREEYQRTGSKVAQSLYAMSLALDGEARTAIGLLSQGAGQGNIYAYHLLSDLYRRTEELANLITSAAYLRAAYLAGDSRAADRYAYQFGILSPPENLLADKEAFRLFKTFGRGRNYLRP